MAQLLREIEEEIENEMLHREVRPGPAAPPLPKQGRRVYQRIWHGVDERQCNKDLCLS